jgi:hypothetical protein
LLWQDKCRYTAKVLSKGLSSCQEKRESSCRKTLILLLSLFLIGCAATKSIVSTDRINHNGYEYETSTGLRVLVKQSAMGDYWSVYIVNDFTMLPQTRWATPAVMTAAREAIEKHTGCKLRSAEYNSRLTMVKVTVKCPPDK